MLKVNKNHKEGTFNKNKQKYYLKVGSLLLAISLFSGILSTNIQKCVNSGTIISLSAALVNSMFFNDDYDRIVSNETMEDFNLTDKAVKNVKELTVDMKRNKDLSFLKYFDSLEKIKLTNLKFLTEKDIVFLKECNAKNIEVRMIANAKEKEILLKLSTSLNDRNISLEIDTALYPGELGEYIVYDISKEIPSNVLIMNQSIDQEKCKRIDKKILQFIKTIDFSETKNEKDILYILIQKITKFISYDYGIYDSEGNYNTEKIKNYNANLLSSILTSISTNENSGICCNYAALLCVSSYKMGLESYYVPGYYTLVEDAGHAWNLVNVDNQYKYIDLTDVDMSEYLEEYEEMVIENYKYMIDEGIDLDYYLSSYDYENNIVNKEKSDLVYYNVEREGEKIQTKKPDKVLSTIIGIGTGAVTAVIYDLIKKKKEQKEEQEAKKR